MTDLTAHKKSFENGVQFAWDATSLDLAQTCMRKYYYSLILGIKPKEESVHLLFGGIYASALEHFYKYRAEGQDIHSALRTVIREALVESWDFERGVPKAFDDVKKTRANLIRTIVWYVEQFGIEEEHGIKTFHLENGKPACELSFALELTPEIMYCGHLDRVVLFGDHLYVMDQKTTGGTVGTYYFNTFSPNNQMSGYAFAGQAVLHSPVRGVIIDAAQIAINFTRFERGITTRSKDQLEEWLHSTVGFIKQAQEWTAEGFFPMNPNSCGNYGGCKFRNLCSSSPKVRENYIKSDFTTHDWDPVKER